MRLKAGLPRHSRVSGPLSPLRTSWDILKKNSIRCLLRIFSLMTSNPFGRALRRFSTLLVALGLGAGSVHTPVQAAPVQAASKPAAAKSAAPARVAATPAAIADYKRKLKEYQEARDDYEAEASAYWDAIAQKRRGRNAKRRNGMAVMLDDYVLSQPPVYGGPKRPVNPQPQEAEPERPRKPPRPIPVVADLVRAAAEQFQFVPQRPASELDFKRAYAAYAVSEGLTREQAVRVYAFETGGIGTYDSQAGRLRSGSSSKPISTAIGYNQLLTTNSIELVAEQGHRLLEALNARAAQLAGAPRRAMEQKIAAFRRMLAFCRSVPDDWSEHDKLADTAQGWAVHALVLDVDIGPMLQTHKLATSIQFALMKGYRTPLTAAELEMMNLTGDGTGLDMVTMPDAMRAQVPTANFMQRSGYERNPVVSRNNTVSRLLAITDAKMDSGEQTPGSRELAGAF